MPTEKKNEPTLAPNRHPQPGFAYFWLMLMPRPVRVGYLLRRALRALR